MQCKRTEQYCERREPGLGELGMRMRMRNLGSHI